MTERKSTGPESWTEFHRSGISGRLLYLWNHGRRRGADRAAGHDSFLTNLTSAGQFAGLGVIQAGASFAEMALTELIINLRYCLMSCSLSQKLARNMPFFHRFFMAYGVTDEIFGVSVCREGILSPWYSYGLISAAVPGWTFGTLLGAVSGSILPQRLLSALGVALYGMFLAVILPPARKNKILMELSSFPWGRACCFPCFLS